MATSLNAQFSLSQDSTFQGRVRASACAAAIAIHNETFTNKTVERDAFAKQVLLNSITNLQQLLSFAVAVDSTVANLAGDPAIQASVTDTAINNAVSAAWNAFAVRD